MTENEACFYASMADARSFGEAIQVLSRHLFPPEPVTITPRLYSQPPDPDVIKPRLFRPSGIPIDISGLFGFNVVSSYSMPQYSSTMAPTIFTTEALKTLRTPLALIRKKNFGYAPTKEEYREAGWTVLDDPRSS